MGLIHGACVQAAPADMAAMRDTQILVIAAGRGGQHDEAHLDLLRENARVARDMGRLLVSFARPVVWPEVNESLF